MQAMQPFTIVTVTYNSRRVLPTFLASVDMPDVRIIVVDNGSSDDTRAIAARDPRVQVIAGSNVGYGRGANAGFAQVDTPYGLLANPDMVFMPGALGHLMDTAKAHPELGILGGRLFQRDASGREDFRDAHSYDADGLAYTHWIVGALMLMRMDAFRQLGGFDEKIFLFYEETDLCRRFVDAGYRLAIVKAAMAEHEEGGSSTESLRVLRIKSWHAAWSKAYYFRKHFSWMKYADKCFSRIVRALTKMPVALLRCNRRSFNKNLYELLGVLGYMAGMDAFKNGTGRLT